jgi:tetratricopeptide (TPR) repeat protein
MTRARVETVDELRALRLAGKHAEHVEHARAYVADHPGDVHAQLEAAYGNDRAGDERTAIIHYEEAYRLGVPVELRRRFLVGFGSTLRNVGRAEDAVNVLAQAIEADPQYPSYAAFLALALADAGHPKAALATLLGCTLDAARDDAFDGYERALAGYHRALLEAIVS